MLTHLWRLAVAQQLQKSFLLIKVVLTIERVVMICLRQTLDVAAGSHVLDEAERSLHDALCVLSQTVQDARVVYGGGFPEMQMAKVRHPPSTPAGLGIPAGRVPDVILLALHTG